jgi:hypothetical protein
MCFSVWSIRMKRNLVSRCLFEVLLSKQQRSLKKRLMITLMISWLDALSQGCLYEWCRYFCQWFTCIIDGLFLSVTSIQLLKSPIRPTSIELWYVRFPSRSAHSQWKDIWNRKEHGATGIIRDTFIYSSFHSCLEDQNRRICLSFTSWMRSCWLALG